MKITFILPPLNMAGGIKVVGIYAKAFADRGHKVVIVSPAHPKITLKQRFKSLIKELKWLSTPDSYPSHIDGLNIENRILAENRPILNDDVPDADVVIATWWETAEWVAQFTPSKGKQCYFIQGYEVFDYLPIDRVKATYRLPLKKIVISKWLKDLMKNQYADDSAILINNAVDHGQFNSAPREKQSIPTVGFLFSSTPLKGIDVTLKALDILRERYSDLRIISFGIYEWNRDLFPDVEFYYSPPQDKIRDLYALCDVWLTASRSEGFNLPAMEAMACRTPVVSTRTGWPEEAIIAAENGFLVDIDDFQELAKAAQSILSMTNEQWKTMSENAHATVASYSWEKSILQFEDVLATAIKSGIDS